MPEFFKNNNIKFFVQPFENKSIEEFINKCYYDLQSKFCEVNYSNPFLFFIIAYDEKFNPVGFLQATNLYENFEIEQIFVLDKYRSQKYGAKLLEALLEYAQEMNCESISLEVNVNNNIAVKLYEKFDFKKEAIRKKYYDNKDDAYLMVRKVVIKNEK